MLDRNEISSSSIWGLASVAGVSAFALLSVLRSRQTQSSNQICSAVEYKPSLRENNESISNSIQRYRDFIRQAGSDRRAISRAISEYHSEVGVLNKYLQVELDAIGKRSDTSIRGITYFQSEKPQNSNISRSIYSELLAVYHELIVTYPIGEFEDWTTKEDISRITAALAEAAHADYEEHHQKMLDVARELLGDLDATVRPVRHFVANTDRHQFRKVRDE